MKSKLFFTLHFSLFISLSSPAVNVETDRTWYLAGEAMTISVTADDALIAYAELCDTQGLAAGAVVGLHAGTGRGIIELPPHLHSGYYVLSVYTHHSADVAQRIVPVVNTLRKSADDDIEWIEATHPDSRSCSTAGISPTTFHLPPSTISVDVCETEGHIIQARVRNVYGGNVFDGSQICPSLAIVGKQIHYFEGKMVNDSLAVFYTYGIHGKLPLVLSALTSTGVSLPIEMISPFAALLPKQLPHLVFHYKRSEVEARSMDMQRHQMGRGKNQAEVVPLGYDETLFGTKPDLSYNLDEYRQFLTIREVLLEYVSCVKKTKIDGRPQLFVRKEQEHYNTVLPSLVLIDGMPVIDIERLLDYDARRIHYINIYGNQYTFGNGVYNGILSFVTRSGQLTNYPTEPNAQYLVYDFPW